MRVRAILALAMAIGVAPQVMPVAQRTVPSSIEAEGNGTDSIQVEIDSERIVPLDSASGLLTVEPSVAIHASILVVSWNDSHGGHIDKPSHDVGTAVSFDRGMSFRSRIPAPILE